MNARRRLPKMPIRCPRYSSDRRPSPSYRENGAGRGDRRRRRVSSGQGAESAALKTLVGSVFGVGVETLLAGPHSGLPVGGAFGSDGFKLQLVVTNRAMKLLFPVVCSPS